MQALRSSAKAHPARASACNRARTFRRVMASSPHQESHVSGSKPSVALLGVGLMGRKMAQRLQSVGHSVTVWNRDAQKAKALEPACQAASTAAEAIQSGSVVVLMLADAPVIRQVLLEEPAAKAALAGKTVVMMSTIGPAESRELGAAITAAGAALYVEAPVLGSQPEAEKGTLQVMVGCAGDAAASPAWPVLCALGGTPKVLGGLGSAAAVKLALNQMIAIETIGFCSSLGLVQKSGADVDGFMDILRGSALYAPTFDKKLAKYLSRDFGTANFPTKHLLKDVRLFQKEAEELGLATPIQQACEQLCQEACSRTPPVAAEGGSAGPATLADADYSAVYEAVVYPNGTK